MVRPLRLLLLLGLTWGASAALAQTYEPGWLVRATGDTLRGDIENGFWDEPPAFIRFRPTPGSPSQLFQPHQLRAVRFTGGRYFRYEALPIDRAAETRLDYLPRGNTANIRVESLLAEVLVEGAVTLLRVKQLGPTHYLLLRPGQPVLDLSERQYLRQAPNRRWVAVDGNNYRNQLGLYFRECPAADRAAQTAPFTAAGLAAVVQTYNTTCDPARQPGQSWVGQDGRWRQVAFQGGVLAGLRYNRIESPTASDGSCVDCQVRPFGGLYADLFQPSRTAALYGELSVSTFRTGISRYVWESPLSTSPVYRSYAYHAWLATARLGVRRFFPLPHEQQWLVGFGYELNIVFNPTMTSSSLSPALPNEVDVPYAEPTLLPNVDLGWRSRRWTVSLDGQLYQLYRADANYALRLGMAYRLGRNPDDARRQAPARPE